MIKEHNMMVIDSHIHVGQYKSLYETPQELVSFLTGVGVSYYAVSSCTICEEDYKMVLDEMRELIALAKDKVLPVLWITPRLLHHEDLDKFLYSGIQWKCVKIHPWLNMGGWDYGSEDREKAIALAKDLQVPLLIHTGETEGSYPSCFEQSVAEHSDVTFILAHGRPVDEAINIMKKYKNAWVDTAFMPTENIVKCCKAGCSDRVLWGSDYPIPKYYYSNKDMKRYYNELLEELKQQVSYEDYIKITQTNAQRLFNI